MDYDSFSDPTSDLLQQLKQLEITVEKNKSEVTAVDNKDKEQDDKVNQLDDKQINLPAQGEIIRQNMHYVGNKDSLIGHRWVDIDN